MAWLHYSVLGKTVGYTDKSGFVYYNRQRAERVCRYALKHGDDAANENLKSGWPPKSVALEVGVLLARRQRRTGKAVDLNCPPYSFSGRGVKPDPESARFMLETFGPYPKDSEAGVREVERRLRDAVGFGLPGSSGSTG